jgi:hypothetical protein
VEAEEKRLKLDSRVKMTKSGRHGHKILRNTNSVQMVYEPNSMN